MYVSLDSLDCSRDLQSASNTSPEESSRLGTTEKRFEWEAIFSRNALIISPDDRFVLSVTVEISIGWLSDSSVSALIIRQCCPAKSRTESVGWRYRVILRGR